MLLIIGYFTATVRPVPNVVLLPCLTQMKLSFRFKQGSSTWFETIMRGTAELGSVRLLRTANLAVPRGSSTTCLQTACYCRTEVNVCCIICIYCRWMDGLMRCGGRGVRVVAEARAAKPLFISSFSFADGRKLEIGSFLILH